MSPITRLCAASLAAATIALPTLAQAGDNAVAVCSVSIDYTRNNVLGHAYRQDFVVQEGTAYVDDFSSATRVRQFSAVVSKASGDLTVSFDYLNDVGVFLSVGFNAALTIRGGGAAQTSSGSQSTYISSAFSAVGGSHTTAYQITCRRV